jgi:hypothetical protein
MRPLRQIENQAGKKAGTKYLIYRFALPGFDSVLWPFSQAFSPPHGRPGQARRAFSLGYAGAGLRP